jgi:hypothetical protein
LIAQIPTKLKTVEVASEPAKLMPRIGRSAGSVSVPKMTR